MLGSWDGTTQQWSICSTIEIAREEEETEISFTRCQFHERIERERDTTASEALFAINGE
jgi:hypothetical protein